MREALLGGFLGLASGALSVYSLWLITGFTARAAEGLRVEAKAERVSGWDVESEDGWTGVATPSPTVSPAAPPQGEPAPEGAGMAGATLRVFFAFLLKAPILVAVAFLAQSLGTAALHWCVGGVVLVYSFAVIWAAGQTNRR